MNAQHDENTTPAQRAAITRRMRRDAGTVRRAESAARVAFGAGRYSDARGFIDHATRAADSAIRVAVTTVTREGINSDARAALADAEELRAALALIDDAYRAATGFDSPAPDGWDPATDAVSATAAPEPAAGTTATPGPYMRDYGADVDYWHGARDAIGMDALADHARDLFDDVERIADRIDEYGAYAHDADDVRALRRARNFALTLVPFIADTSGTVAGVTDAPDVRHRDRRTNTSASPEPAALAKLLDAIGDHLDYMHRHGREVLIPAAGWVDHVRALDAEVLDGYAPGVGAVDPDYIDWDTVAESVASDYVLVTFDARRFYLRSGS